jgi:hypothetical protein
MTARTVSIGCSSGFWGDSAYAAAQLVHSGRIRYLVSDYLAEITMSLLAAAKARKPEAGFPPDFIGALAPLLPDIKRQGIRVVSNAGGMNPRACRAALEAAAAQAGLCFRIAVVEGDDLMPQLPAVRASGPTEMNTGAPLPEHLASCNAYLGARPIAAALDAGAEVVLTGRCVDSAVTLGILMHEFGWRDSDHDLLAAGSLAGHVIECGPQCTGGIFTDWRDVADGWDNMGYPIVEVSADGSFVVTKPEGTGGLVSVGTVAEQILYEIGDPAAYQLPDVCCDFRWVHLEPVGPDQVKVSGARGLPPGSQYKVSATWHDGWRVIATMLLAGRESGLRARRMGEAIVRRTARLNEQAGRPDYAEASIEVIGAEDTYCALANRQPGWAEAAREVVLKIGLRHPDKVALELFAREMMQAGVAMAQGTTGVFGGRPTPSPVLRLFSFLIDKAQVTPTVELDGQRLALPLRVPTGHSPSLAPTQPAPQPASQPPPEPLPQPPPQPLPQASADAATLAMPPFEISAAGPMVSVPLIRLAWGRSGDKGNHANIGVIARKPAYADVLRRELTAERVADFFAHLAPGAAPPLVQRWELPGLHAFNYLLKDVLGGGGVASLRYDPQGKSYAQMLMDLAMAVPAGLAGDILEDRST